ncbi:MAG: DUF523 domain-containing protein [Candidatus Latescibacterota bacterium]
MEYLVSACLAGIRCRYDGGHCERPEIRRLLAEGRALPVCPEQLGGLPTPRIPAEISGEGGEAVLRDMAKVIDQAGSDVTAAFILGAQESWRLAQLMGATKAILKERSPSCGVTQICRGGEAISGEGVTCYVLRTRGIFVQGME